MRKLPLDESYHEEIDQLLNDPEQTREELENYEQDFHPRPLRPLNEETIQKLVYVKHDFFNCYYYAIHALEGLPEQIKKTLRTAALIHAVGEEHVERCSQFAQELGKFFDAESQKWLELAKTIDRDEQISL